MSATTTTTTTAMNTGKCMYRAIQKIIPQQPSHWVGDGFHVHPVLGPYAFTEDISPWLMFDYAKPKTFPPTSRKLGVGQHPHRGFETITIAFQGEVEHADSVGNRDVIGRQDVQWMTAGRGILHEEFHSQKFAKEGGTFEMCQLWLNLPKKHKMTKPRYQPILDKQIPVVPLPNDVGRVRVIAGAMKTGEGDDNAVVGPAKTFSPVELFDVIIDLPKTPIEIPIPKGHNVLVFVRKGAIQMMDPNETKIGPQAVALMKQGDDDHADDVIGFQALERNSQVLILGGEPLNESIAARGPFVMNTQRELQQAWSDFYAGKFGN